MAQASDIAQVAPHIRYPEETLARPIEQRATAQDQQQTQSENIQATPSCASGTLANIRYERLELRLRAARNGRSVEDEVRVILREAAQLKPVPSKYPYTEAMTHFARALGAARGGNAAEAHADIERITALRDDLTAAKNLYWANEVEVMRLSSLAWAALAQKKGDEALDLMRQAADTEDKSEKNIVTPGRLRPARELLGDMLMELGRPAEALKEYEASQLREPNRYRGLYGAGQAAAQSGNRDKARHYFAKLMELAGSGNFRPEMEKARQYVASN